MTDETTIPAAPDESSATTLLRNQPTIDSHVHLVDRTQFRYPWLSDTNCPTALNRDWSIQQYDHDRQGINITKIIFIEVDVHTEDAIQETKWACSNPRISGVCAQVPCHMGRVVTERYIQQIAHTKLRGVRRLIQDENIDFCLQNDFVEGVKVVGEHNLVFELLGRYQHLTNVLELCRICPDVTFVLDHMAIKGCLDKGQKFDEWKMFITNVAKLSNVYCKISGLVTEIGAAWTQDDVEPCLSHCLGTFGYDRCLFGSDWFVQTLGGDYGRWFDVVGLVARKLGATDEELRDLFYDTAARVYRL